MSVKIIIDTNIFLGFFQSKQTSLKKLPATLCASRRVQLFSPFFL